MRPPRGWALGEILKVEPGTMKQLPRFRVLRHRVPVASDGLSPLQRRSLDDTARIRIFSAPTGSGKSYAFQRAVIERHKRVLFIVPTRRLAQNLARSLVEALEDDSDASAAQRVVLWTSDERERLKEETPDLNIGRLRYRQMRGMEMPSDGGIMVIATPESLAWMLLRPGFHPHGLPPVDLSDLIRFDHVVFDEFHVIDARGFGLSAAVARMVSRLAEGAYITFLSATPIDIKPTLTAFDIPSDRIRTASEDIVVRQSGLVAATRAIHGDVDYEFIESESMLDVLKRNEGKIRICLSHREQVVVVFDSLTVLNQEKEYIAGWLDDIGVSRKERMTINSIDDSISSGDDMLYTIGRDRDPLDYKFLLTTSSVEVGVTFRAGLMLMDPGFDPASFVQRCGRVARGDQTGRVIVRITEVILDQHPWLRKLITAFPNDGSSITVRRFIDVTLESARSRFDSSEDDFGDKPPNTFASLSQRAVWCAAVFWAALEKANHLRLGHRRTLESFTPKKAKYVLAELSAIKKAGLRSADKWYMHFLDEARCFRSILPRVRVRDVTENPPRSVPWNVYSSHIALQRAPARFNSDCEIEIYLDRRLDEVIRTSERTEAVSYVEALFPHKMEPIRLRSTFQREDWLTEARRVLRQPLNQARKRALESACNLVRISGIVPTVRVK